MQKPFSICLMLALSLPALAQEDVPDEADAPAEVPEVDPLDALRVELEAVKTAAGASEEARASAEALLNAAALLGDSRIEVAERAAAAETLGSLADERAVPFLWMGVRDESDAVRGAVYSAGAAYPGAATTALAKLGLLTESGSAVDAAAALLVAQKSPEAGGILFDMAESPVISAPARAAAKAALQTGYPELLAERGAPAAVSGNIGSSIMAIANAVLGGVSLASIGEFGQDDAAVGIGAIGGAGIGAGGSLLYTRIRPVTDGQGLAYASATGWGLAAGHMLGEVLFTDPNHDDEEERHRRLTAALRTVGVLGGAALGTKALDGEPNMQDVMEVNVGGYFGAQVAIGVVDVFNQRPESSDDYDDLEWRDKRYRIQRGAALVGAAGGAGLTYTFRGTWQPDLADLGFASVAGMEGFVLGLGTPIAIWDDYRDGGIRLGFHLGSIAGLTYSHFRPVTHDQTTFTAWNAAAGNLLGLGLWSLADVDKQEGLRFVMPLGAAGFVYGAWMGEGIELSRNDHVLMYVGTGLGSWNSIALGAILDDQENIDEHTGTGVAITGSALSGIATAYAATRLDIDRSYTTFVGTSASWGFFYAGAMGIAIQPDWDTGQIVGSLLASSDAAAGLAAWAGSEAGFINPEDAALASLGGLTGATLGSLAVFMGTDDESSVAVGAMVGATLGLGAGAVLTPRIKSKMKNLEKVARYLPDPPGVWRFSLSPTMMENGELGAYVGLKGFGF
jgi:hypothetical protein